MGLQARIARDAANLFLGADTGRLGSFRKSITHTPPTGSPETIQAIVDLDDEDLGQADQINTTEGIRIKRHGLLEILASVDVVVGERPEVCSTFTIDGEVWRAIRVTGRDALDGALQTVHIRRDVKVAAKQPAAQR